MKVKSFFLLTIVSMTIFTNEIKSTDTTILWWILPGFIVCCLGISKLIRARQEVEQDPQIVPVQNIVIQPQGPAV